MVVAGRKKNTVVVVAPSSLFSLIANKGGVNVFRKESLNARFKTFLVIRSKRVVSVGVDLSLSQHAIQRLGQKVQRVHERSDDGEKEKVGWIRRVLQGWKVFRDDLEFYQGCWRKRSIE